MKKSINIWLLGVLSVCCALFAASLSAVEISGYRLATIRQVAVMPVYWQGQFPVSPHFTLSKKHMETRFSGLARASKRFVFSNDVLAADLWSSAEGRRQLAEDYEIDAFINLTVSAQTDLMLWTVRLLSPSMKNYLTETERVPFAWLTAASEVELEKRLQDLLFRMLNRYPIDVFVTSIQGRYLTLSSGLEQNIYENDELKFFQTMIKAQHPVDGSWLGYEQKLLGEARVIESKKHSSIAQITSLSYTDAIRVSDGARVDAIASRRNFQAQTTEGSRYQVTEVGSPIVEAFGQSANAAAKPKPEDKLAVAIPSPRVALNQQETQSTDANGQDLVAAADPEQEPVHSESSGMESQESLRDMLPSGFKELQLQGEHENFAVSGAGAVSNKFPAYVFNRFGLSALQHMTSEVDAVLSGHLRFGASGKGSYFGFGLGFEPLYPIAFRTQAIPSLEKIMIGVLVNFESIAVSGEKLGGWDALSLNPSLHLQGSYHIADLVQTYDYDLVARLTPFDMGEVGVAGKKRKIGDSMSLALEANVIHRMKAQDWEWGGFLGMKSGHWDLSAGSLSQQNLRLGVIGRMRL